MSSVALRTPFWRLFPRFIQPLHSGKVFHPAGFPRAVNQCGVGRFHESIVPSFLLPNYKQSSSFADHSEKHQQDEDSHLATSGAPSAHPRGIKVKLCKLLLAFPFFFFATEQVNLYCSDFSQHLRAVKTIHQEAFAKALHLQHPGRVP